MNLFPPGTTRTDALRTSSDPQGPGPYNISSSSTNSTAPIPPLRRDDTEPITVSKQWPTLSRSAAAVVKPDTERTPGPHKATSAVAGRPALFWVHTSPKSISNGTKPEDLKRRRVAFHPPETDHESAQVQVRPKAELHAAQACMREHSTDRQGQEDVVICSVSSPIPRSMGLQSAIDPFNTSHTPLTDRMMRHLQHFLVDLSQDGVPFQNRRLDTIKRHWGELIQNNEACLHACICVASSDVALRTSELPLKQSSNRRLSPLLLDTFHHRGETIRLVNSGLSDPLRAASDGLIASVSMLLTIEIATGTPAYLKMHLAGLRQMVALRKSFVDVPYPVRYQISWTDIRVACMAYTKPIFPPVRNTRPQGYPILPPTTQLALLASPLLQQPQLPDALIGPQLSEIIFDLVQLTWYAEAIRAADYQNYDEQTEDYFNGEVLYIEYMLLSDRYSQTGTVKEDASIEGCIRLACLLFHNSSIWAFYPANAGVFPQPIIALRTALEGVLATGAFSAYPDLLVWILVMGACSCNVALARERTFFVQTLARVVRLHAITSWKELRARLMPYFYLDRCYLASLQLLWDELLAALVQ
ncbi:short chain dehydrogenase family protein [Aspergillus tubingensis]|uniref:short chain dehydrogenase family protein n=1 Tax=Aspergillus tubingensis TaxID=5068 RepID=UPI0015784CFA|nr:short chain dehydrogenase family protein [Aspergillus tubingensis]GFN21618.1 short chain dehydrogenase family protein [Aspergillus tubingensis]